MKLVFCLIFILLTNQLQAKETQSFNSFVKGLKRELVQKYEFSQTLIDKSFKGIKFNEDVIKSDRSQPEFVRSYGSYLKTVISEKRISKGKIYNEELNDLFIKIFKAHPVQQRFLLSFWAMETNFSTYTGYIDVIEAFATLIYDGRRGRFFKEELISILKVLSMDNFEFPGNRIQGSWAGAIGSTQFLPSKILKYSIDFNEDGKINMWESKPDFLASSAKFLEGEGWNGEENWAYPVTLPEDFNYMNSGLSLRMSIEKWQDLKVTLTNGNQLPLSENTAALFLPQGHKGPKFLVYNNFFRIFRWNNSAKYALAVGILSDQITDQAPYFKNFDLEEENFLSFQMIKLIQTRLNQLGYEAGRADGIFGNQSYRALQKYQQDSKLIPDGHLSKQLVEKLLR